MSGSKVDQSRTATHKQKRQPLRRSSSTPDAAAAADTHPTSSTDNQLAGKPQQQRQQQAMDVEPAAEPTRASKRQRLSKQQQQAAADSAAPGGSAAAVGSVPAMSAFEAERAARIAANMARLAALELPQIAAGLAATAPAAARAGKAAPTQRGVGSKRRRGSDEQQQPTRQSARTRGQAPDPSTAGGIASEARNGTVVLAAAAAGGGSSSAARFGGAAAVLPLEPPGPLPFKSSNGDASSDAAFLALLAAQAAAAAAADPDSADPGSSNDGGDTAAAAAAATGADLSRLSLHADDVAKMTRDGVSCLAFHPSSSKLIIAAADKSGKVSLWDIDHTTEDEGGDAAGGAAGGAASCDGVLMFEAHADYVSSLKWLSGSSLMSASYDGSVRLLDVNTGVWDLLAGVAGADDDNGWSAGEAAPGGALVYLATAEGQLTCHDTRAGSSSTNTWGIASRKVNTLHLHSNQLHLASSASDGSVAVWDVRQLAGPSSSSSSKKVPAAKPVCRVGHAKSSQGAYWAPDGSGLLLSISFDDTLRVWQDAGRSGALQQSVSIRHNNHTGRWVIPFRPAWSPGADTVLVGDMKRGVALFDAGSGAARGMLAADALTAIPSRLALHPGGLPCLAAATSSGRVHIWR